MIHDFNESLERSHSADRLPLWEECYRKFFPTFAGMINHREDGEHQRAGIDRSVILENSKQILIDEKIRFKNSNGKVYADVALEEISNDRTGAPGWVVKPLRADYIAYAIAPLGKCYLLPVIQLQEAWAREGAFWKKQYPKIPAPNNGYVTISWGIPIPILFKAIGACLRCEFTPIN